MIEYLCEARKQFIPVLLSILLGIYTGMWINYNPDPGAKCSCDVVCKCCSKCDCGCRKIQK